MKARTKAEMAEYQRNRRNRVNNDVTPTQNVTPLDVTPDICNTQNVTPEGLKSKVPANYGQANCACMHCRAVKSNKSDAILNHGAYKTGHDLGTNEYNRVSMPGDVDYEPPVKTEPGQLPQVVIDQIHSINTVCEHDDKDKLKTRIANALHYQEVISGCLV